MIKKFQKINNNLFFKFIIIFILSLSNALMSTYLMIMEIKYLYIIITFIVSFLFSVYYIIKNYSKIVNLVENNGKWLCISSLLAFIIFNELKLIGANTIGIVNSLLIPIKHIHFIVLPSIIFITFLIVLNIKNWLIDFVNEMDKFEKKVYIITSAIFLFFIIFLYLRYPSFYLQYDNVYSMDSGWVYSSIMPNLYYYDIRHPLMSILSFPIYAIVNFIFSNTLKPIIFQFINVQLLIIIGLELKRMLKHNFVYILYIISFSTLLYSLFFEKYVLCTFLIVTYLYNIFVNNNNSNKMLVLSVGVLPTNIFICIAELFRNNKIKEKIINIIKIGFTALLILVVTGRIYCLFNGYDEAINMKDSFGGATYTLKEKVNSISNMVHGSLLYIPSNSNGETYLWNNILNNVSIIGIIILVIILAGLFNNIKNKLYIVFLISLLFSFVLFGYFNWSVYESPLFSIMFSWAIIPLLLYGIENIFNLIKINEKHKNMIYISLCIIILIINIYGIVDICKFIVAS